MKVKGIKDEDFVNYKLPSMFVIFPYCTFKCEKECGIQCCQNSALSREPIIDIDSYDLLCRYMNNQITKAVVCGGLEPFDSFNDLYDLICTFRRVTYDDIVIYTGYTEEEIYEQVDKIIPFGNIIIKYGRYIPNSKPVFNEILGVTLASDNQYADKWI